MPRRVSLALTREQIKDRLYLTRGEVAATLNVSVGTVTRWGDQEMLPQVTLGKRVFIPAGKFLELMDGNNL
jgi:excisionase family DNA binding protein